MILEQLFTVNRKDYALMHVTADDSRVVIDARSEEVLFAFDSSLYITDSNSAYVGHLCYPAPGQQWKLVTVDQSVHVLYVPTNIVDWKQVTYAEIAAAEFLLKE